MFHCDIQQAGYDFDQTDDVKVFSRYTLNVFSIEILSYKCATRRLFRRVITAGYKSHFLNSKSARVIATRQYTVMSESVVDWI